MKNFEFIHLGVTNIAKKQIKLKYQTINTYNYEETLLTGITC
jgi:hypothetical protein